jgi:hypothetical protein
MWTSSIESHYYRINNHCGLITAGILKLTLINTSLPVHKEKVYHYRIFLTTSAAGTREALAASFSSRLTVLFLSPSNLPFPVLFLLSHTLSSQICHGGGGWGRGLRSCVGAARGGLRRETKLTLPGGISLSPPPGLPSPPSKLYESICGWVDLWCVEPLCVMYESIGFVDELICDVLNPSSFVCDVWIVSWMNYLMEQRWWEPASMAVVVGASEHGGGSSSQRACLLYSFCLFF